jgi:Right handed beta helix region
MSMKVVWQVVAGTAAIAGLLTLGASPALGNHVRCGDTVLVDTVLDGDIDCETPAALQIGADGVTLDLNGHTIYSGRTAVLNPGFDDVTIQNGRIETVDVGVRLSDADRNTVRGLFVLRFGVPFDVVTGPIHASGSDDSVFTENMLYGYSASLTLIESHRNVITGNHTGYFGCPVLGSCDNNATGGGVVLSASDDNVLEHNAFSQGMVWIVGILGRGDVSDRNAVRKNSFSYSISSGLAIQGGERNVAVKNTSFGHIHIGILASGGIGTRIRKNVVFDNGGAGIYASGDAVRVVRNVASGNAADGIVAEPTAVLVKRNRVIDNGDWGIRADPSVIDGGGNRAAGNGVPAQCLNVICKPAR